MHRVEKTGLSLAEVCRRRPCLSSSYKVRAVVGPDIGQLMSHFQFPSGPGPALARDRPALISTKERLWELACGQKGIQLCGNKTFPHQDGWVRVFSLWQQIEGSRREGTLDTDTPKN